MADIEKDRANIEKDRANIEKEVAYLYMVCEQVTELSYGVYYAGDKVSNMDLFIGNKTKGRIINFNTHKEIDITGFSDKKVHTRPKVFSRSIWPAMLFIKNNNLSSFIKFYFAFMKSYIRQIPALKLDAEKHRMISFSLDEYYIVYDFYIDNKQNDGLILNLTYSNNEKKPRVIKNIKENYDKLSELKDIMPFDYVRRVSIDTCINVDNTDVEMLSLIDKNHIKRYMRGCKPLHSIIINDVNEDIQGGA